MSENTKWDTELMSTMLRTLTKGKEALEKNKSFLENINNEVNAAWQGYAGRTFDQRMDIDVENLQTVIKETENLLNDLKSVIGDCYETCEDDIQSEISSLKSKI